MKEITQIQVIRKEDLKPGDVLIVSYPFDKQPPYFKMLEKLFAPATVLMAQDHYQFRIISAGQARELPKRCDHVWDSEDRICFKCDLSKREALGQQS